MRRRRRSASGSFDGSDEDHASYGSTDGGSTSLMRSWSHRSHKVRPSRAGRLVVLDNACHFPPVSPYFDPLVMISFDCDSPSTNHAFPTRLQTSRWRAQWGSFVTITDRWQQCSAARCGLPSSSAHTTALGAAPSPAPLDGTTRGRPRTRRTRRDEVKPGDREECAECGDVGGWGCPSQHLSHQWLSPGTDRRRRAIGSASSPPFHDERLLLLRRRAVASRGQAPQHMYTEQASPRCG